MRIFSTFILILILLTSLAVAQQKQSWPEYVKGLRAEALAQGIRPEVFDEAFAGIKEPNRKVLHLDKTQPEKRIEFLKYRSTRADAYRIKMGRKEFKKHQQLLQNIGNEFGISPCFIASIWGLETSYGNFMGSFPVIKSLATLAYDNRRAKFFRKELMLALHILNDGHVELKNFKGEWAGASGHPQFLPSSWHKHAVDYNKDGHKDIWNSHADAFASIANYLVNSGWQNNKPWAVAVQLPSGFDKSVIDSKTIKTLGEWKALGIRAQQGETLPQENFLKARVVFPDGGPAMLAFNNFFVIMRWNNSTYYAGTVGYLAEKICQRRL